MDKRVEVRCTAEELARWKQAAGAIPLSRWIRLQCERTLDRRKPLPQVESQAVFGDKVFDMHTREQIGTVSAPAFRPDFKGER
jgi:hypothetical protein